MRAVISSWSQKSHDVSLASRASQVRWPRSHRAARFVACNLCEAICGLEIKVDGPPGTQRLEIAYTALALRAPERVAFRYALEGYDRD